MLPVSGYNNYRQFGKDYLSRTSVWRHKKKRKLVHEENVQKLRRIETAEDSHSFTVSPEPRLQNNHHFSFDDHSPTNEAVSCESNEINFDLHDIAEDISDKSSTTNFKPKNLLEFINSDGFFDPINLNVSRSRAEVFFMLIEYCKHNNLTKTATANLFKLINVLFPEDILPDTEHMLDKILNGDNKFEFHAICHECTAYHGPFGQISEEVTCCYNCDVKLDIFNPSKKSSYVLIDPSIQISDLLTVNKNYYESILKNERVEDGVIRDVFDGLMYKQFLRSLTPEQRKAYVSACINSDGAEKFQGPHCSAWPIFAQINELPPQERINKLVVCGIWFNKNKPNMSVFLDPFVDMMNQVQVKMKIDNETTQIKLHVLSCCVDSSARPGMQGLKQFNGKQGCNWCLHPGEHHAGSMRYPILLNVPDRTHEDTLKTMVEDDLNTPVDGIKQPSPFINFEYFNLVKAFLIDYFHAALEGAGEQVYNYLIDMLDSLSIEELDEIVRNISLPKQVSKLSKEISKRKDWSARDKENFILYYSVPLFELKLSSTYCIYWKKFVNALYILLKDEIRLDELDEADKLLHEFVVLTQTYFGLRSMTFNIHQMLHLSKNVLNWGPLWSMSCFGFEAANRQILQAIKSARGVPFQIVRFVNMNHAEFVLKEHVMKNVASIVKSYFENVLQGRIRNFLNINGNIYYGKKEAVPESVRVKFGLSKDSYKFKKVIKKNCLYAHLSKDNLRTNNSFARLIDDNFIQIKYFIVDVLQNIEITCGHFLKVKDFSRMSKDFKMVKSICSDQVFIHTASLNKVCVFVHVDEKRKYIIPVPNLLHYN